MSKSIEQILEEASQDICKQYRQGHPKSPESLDRDYNFSNGVVGSVVGAVGLGYVGSHIGIAMLGTAVSGMWPLAILGGILGLAMGGKK